MTDKKTTDAKIIDNDISHDNTPNDNATDSNVTDKHKQRMQKIKEKVDSRIDSATDERGLLIVITGNGKGKSTSGFGTVARAVGHGLNAAVAQFIKGTWACGERQLLENAGVNFSVMATGFTWNTQDKEKDIAAAQHVWIKCKALLSDTNLDLVLLDEIGRGTSTYDGLSLAWACAEMLALKTKAFTLFATHYFELTMLADQIESLANVHLDAMEHDDNIVFMHAVQEGAASKSFGLQVAQLAGVPKMVIKRAKQRLSELELQQAPTILTSTPMESNAFEQPSLALEEHPALTTLIDTDIDDLSPRQALDLLYVLKGKCNL